MAQRLEELPVFGADRQPGAVTRPLRIVRALWRFALKKPLGAAGAVVIMLFLCTALAAPFIATHSAYVISGRERLLEPSGEHYFGTDDLGRDVFSRVVYGARVSLQVGLIAVGVSVTLGTTLGLLSGYFGGALDQVIQRLVDAMMAFPGLVLALTLVAVFGASITNIMIAIGISMAPGTSRVVRGSVLSVRANQYIEAAEVLGASHLRVLLAHVLPNVVAPIIIIATAGLGGAILTEGSLSFLGLGTPPPTPSWGGMLSGSSRTFMERAPWLAIFPGIAITLAVLGFSLLGDAIRDVLDPRLRGT